MLNKKKNTDAQAPINTASGGPGITGTKNGIAANTIAIVKRLEGKLKRGLKNISAIYLKTTMSSPVKIKL